MKLFQFLLYFLLLIENIYKKTNNAIMKNFLKISSSMFQMLPKWNCFGFCSFMLFMSFYSCDTLQTNKANAIPNDTVISHKMEQKSIKKNETIQEKIIHNNNNKVLSSDSLKIDSVNVVVETNQELGGNISPSNDISSSDYLATLIPFVILLLGLIGNWIAEKMKNKQEISNFRCVIFLWLESIQGSLKEQCVKIEELSQVIKVSEDSNPERFAYKALTYNKLNEISIEKYISVFIINSVDRNGNIEILKDNMYKMINCFEFLVKVDGNIKEQYEEYRKSYINTMNQCNNSYLKLLGLIKEVDSNKEKYSQDDITLHNSIVRIVSDYISICEKEVDSKKNKQIIYKNLVEPIERMIPKTSSIYFNEVKSVVMEYKAIKRQWDVNQEGYSLNFVSYSKSMISAYDKLESISRYLEKETKVKNLFRI